MAAGIVGAGLVALTADPLSGLSDPAGEYIDSIQPYWRDSLLGTSRFSGLDDDFNTIEGLRHGRMAGDLRGRYTDFGSGWIPGRGVAEDLSDSEFSLDRSIEARRRIKAARKSGDISQAELLSFQRSHQYAQDATLSEYLLDLGEDSLNKHRLASGYLLNKVGSYISPGPPNPETMYGVNLDPRVLEFRKNVLQDPAAYAEFQEEYKAAQREGREQLGKFNRSEMLEDDFSRYEGVSLHASNLRTINLKNFIVDVEDADTLVLRRKGLMNTFDKPIHVRLAGIDAPEVAGHKHDPMAKWRINQEQPFGAQATSILKGMLQGGGYESGFERLFGEEGEDINLIIDPSQQTYGRYLGMLAGDQGRNINLELLREGAVSALPWGSASGDILDRSLAAEYEAEAAEEERGMWRHTRYKAIREMGKALGTTITYNQYTDITKLAAKPDFAGWAGYLEGMGPTQYRPLHRQERSAIRGVANNLRRSGFSNRRRPAWQSNYNSGGRTSGLRPLNPPGQNLKYKLYQSQIPLTAKDDAYVNVEGLRHGGSAAAGRRQTDFGSGWSSTKNSIKSFWFPKTKETFTVAPINKPPPSSTSVSSYVDRKIIKDSSIITSVAARGVHQGHIPAEKISQVKNTPNPNKKDLASKEFVRYDEPSRNRQVMNKPDLLTKRVSVAALT